jgi:hypothetical protein
LNIKISKQDITIFDAEKNILSSRSWAFRFTWSDKISDKEISGLVQAGKSFTREFGGKVNFESRMPDFKAVLDDTWEEEKANYSPASMTKWAYLSGDIVSVEYQNEKGERAYFKQEYSKMMEENGAQIYVKDSDSPAFMVASQEGDYVMGIVMPIRIEGKR